MVIDIAICTDAAAFVNDNAHAMVMKTGVRSHGNLGWKNTAKAKIDDGFNQPWRERNLVKVTPAR
jgi:hypothetical protein